VPISRDVEQLAPEVVKLRRVIHQYPERGFEETRTAELIRTKLDSWGVEHRPVCGTGVIAMVRGKEPGPTWLLRADMDALPLEELNDVPSCTRAVTTATSRSLSAPRASSRSAAPSFAGT
jgi:amidohydrolase